MTTNQIIDRLTPPGTTSLPLSARHADKLRPLAEVLPTRHYFSTRCEADAYGASWEIAGSLGLSHPPTSSASWIHNVPITLACPEQFTYTSPPTTLHLVGTASQVAFLARHHCDSSVAVGMPYLYAAEPEVRRIPRSLLFAPASSHISDLKAPSWKEYQRRYLQAICDFRRDFDVIVASMKSHTQADQGNWYDMLEEFDIPWITGGDLHDMNNLRRVKTMFSSFEVVLFNAWTSGCAYAAWSGARVCVFGPEPPQHEADKFIERQNMKRLRYMGQQPDPREARLLKAFYGVDQYSLARDQYPWLFVEPTKAILAKEHAGEALGATYKRSPEEIARLLGWHYCAGDASGELSGGDPHTMAATLGWIPRTMGGTTALLQAHLQLDAAGKTLAQALPELSECQSRADAAIQKSKAKIDALKKEQRKLARELSALRESQRLWAWRLVGKPLASIERRVRRLAARCFGKDGAAT